LSRPTVCHDTGTNTEADVGSRTLPTTTAYKHTVPRSWRSGMSDMSGEWWRKT